MRDTTKALEEWLSSGGRQIGQVLIAPQSSGWELRHREDAAREDLTSYFDPDDARGIANLDDHGAYRPLKSAPNLRHGWRLQLADAAGVRLALDFLYPAALGLWLSEREGRLRPVCLRDTLARQSGMYRVTQKITDEQAQALVAGTCRSSDGCLKTIRWQLDAQRPITSLPPDKFTPPGGDTMPLHCHEACNLLVAAARKVVKSEA